MAVLLLALSIGQGAKAQTITTQALQAMQNKNWKKAHALTAQSKDPLLAKLYYWEKFQVDSSDTSFDRLSQFIEQNPDWPNLRSIRRQLEVKINKSEHPVKIIAWFDKNPPLTAEGFQHYAAALLRQREREKLREVVGEWWATTLMNPVDQKSIYRQYKTYIPLEAHRRRFDKLLFNKQYSNARAVANVLGEGYPELAEARIALSAGKNDVNQYINKVPRALQSDPGLLYERLKWRRINNLNDRAIEILNNPPPAEQVINPEDWWLERHIIIRRLLEEGKYETAYTLAANHIQKDGFAFAQAQWLTGWLALRFMNKPAEAYQRFESLNAKVSTPVSKARATYWAARAASALRAEALADLWYKRAALYQTVFYGQRAGEHVGLNLALKNAAPPVLTAAEEKTFTQDQLIRAAILYNAAGMNKRTTEFLWAFAKHENKPERYLFAANQAATMQRYHDAIRISKEATKEGLFLTLQSYPTMLQNMKDVDPRIEWALVHALIRQESQFDPKAVSHAGALGLMQLMPPTAKQVAEQKGVPHSNEWLIQRPSHNIALGSRFLADLIDRYNGSYILAIAAYNAGPGRVNQWIKAFGDPRTDAIDMEDWIELIPIYETRNYIQRVMEGLYVYRLRLKGKNHAQPRTLAYIQ